MDYGGTEWNLGLALVSFYILTSTIFKKKYHQEKGERG
jgi:hypothetical protein